MHIIFSAFCVMLGSMPGIAQLNPILEEIERVDLLLDTQPDQALAICDSLLSLSKIDSLEKAHVYYAQSDAYYYREDIRLSAAAAQQSFRWMPSHFPLEKKLILYNSQGQNFDFLGKIDSAHYYYQAGLALAKQLNDTVELSNLYFNIGITYKSKSDYHRALTYLDSAYQIEYKIQDSFGMSYVLRAVGHMQGLMGESALAIENYKKASSYVTVEDFAQRCVIYTSISSQYLQDHQNDSSFYYLSKAEVCYQNLSDKTTLNYFYKLKGLYQLSEQDTFAAIQTLHKGKENAFEVGDIQEFLTISLLIIEIDPKGHSSQEVHNIIEQLKDAGLHEVLQLGYKVYSKILQKEGRYKDALAATNEAHQLQEELNQHSTQQIIQRQSAEFDLLQKENQIQLINERLKTQKVEYFNYALIIGFVFFTILGWLWYRYKRSKMLHTQDQLLQEANHLKEVTELESQAFRAQMNPHFIFNSLNSIKGLIITHRDKDAAMYISKFSKLVRNILDHSREKLIPLSKELETLELYLNLEKMRFRDGFTYDIKISKQIENNYILLPPTIIQPFVENSIWHGFKNNQRANHIDIDLNIVYEDLIISVIDNGVGRQKSSLSNLDQKRKSHGLKITEQRIRSISQKTNQSPIEFIDLYDESGKSLGTKVTIKIPIIHE